MKRGYRSRVYTFFHRIGIRWGRSSDGKWTNRGAPVGFVGAGINQYPSGKLLWINVWEFGIWIGWHTSPAAN